MYKLLIGAQVWGSKETKFQEIFTSESETEIVEVFSSLFQPEGPLPVDVIRELINNPKRINETFYCDQKIMAMITTD